MTDEAPGRRRSGGGSSWDWCDLPTVWAWSGRAERAGKRARSGLAACSRESYAGKGQPIPRPGRPRKTGT